MDKEEASKFISKFVRSRISLSVFKIKKKEINFESS